MDTSFEARIFATLDQHAARVESVEKQIVISTVGIMAAMLLIALGMYTVGKQLEK